MRIVAWNCNMALHRKFDALARLRPDIAVLPESAEPERVREKAASVPEAETVWVGDNPNKGLSVLAFNGYRAELAQVYDPAIRHLAPVHVSGPRSFNLLAVWALNTAKEGWTRRRVAPLLKGMERYDGFLRAASCVVAGDFNNHVVWDRPDWPNNHANAVAALAQHGLVSAYHAHGGIDYGGETAPTIYWRDRRADGPTYHIDYIYLPERWMGGVTEMSVGSFEDWCGSRLSDHVPLVVEVDPGPAG